MEWHKQFAFLPMYIHEVKADAIVCPAHMVWLEYVERKRRSRCNYEVDEKPMRRIDWTYNKVPLVLDVFEYRSLPNGYSDG